MSGGAIGAGVWWLFGTRPHGRLLTSTPGDVDADPDVSGASQTAQQHRA